MPCDTRTRLPNQTAQQRKAEVRDAVSRLSAALVAGTARAVVGPQGALTFTGWPSGAEMRVTDACAYRMVMATGSALAKAAIAKAEALAGRGVSRQALTQGFHSHDGGVHWHHGH
jgi:hypothetical protein